MNSHIFPGMFQVLKTRLEKKRQSEACWYQRPLCGWRQGTNVRVGCGAAAKCYWEKILKFRDLKKGPTNPSRVRRRDYIKELFEVRRSGKVLGEEGLYGGPRAPIPPAPASPTRRFASGSRWPPHPRASLRSSCSRSSPARQEGGPGPAGSLWAHTVIPGAGVPSRATMGMQCVWKSLHESFIP